MTAGLDALFEGLKKTLTVPEVAELLNMTKPGIYKWLREGVLPGYKVGSTWFIIRDELRQTLEKGSNIHLGSDKVDAVEAGDERTLADGE